MINLILISWISLVGTENSIALIQRKKWGCIATGTGETMKYSPRLSDRTISLKASQIEHYETGPFNSERLSLWQFFFYYLSQQL